MQSVASRRVASAAPAEASFEAASRRLRTRSVVKASDARSRNFTGTPQGNQWLTTPFSSALILGAEHIITASLVILLAQHRAARLRPNPARLQLRGRGASPAAPAGQGAAARPDQARRNSGESSRSRDSGRVRAPP